MILEVPIYIYPAQRREMYRPAFLIGVQSFKMGAQEWSYSYLLRKFD